MVLFLLVCSRVRLIQHFFAEVVFELQTFSNVQVNGQLSPAQANFKEYVLNTYVPGHDLKLGFNERAIKARLFLSGLAGVKRTLKIFACKGILLQ